MPFVTEEIWQSVRHALAPGGHGAGGHDAEALVVAPYPLGEAGLIDPAAERQAATLMDTVRAVRNLRAERKLDPSRAVEAYLVVPDAALRESFVARAELIEALARAAPLHIVADAAEAPKEGVATAVLSDVTVVLPLADLVDAAAERARLAKEIAETEAYVERTEAQIAKARGRAPEKVVQGMEDNLAAARARLTGLRARLDELT
jgi:valyl-tRNA synthetase